jgi:hypothetical protein
VICDDFRARWAVQDPVEGVFDDGELAEHRSSCDACAAYARQFDAMDNLIGAAIVVTPPPDLVARLYRLPASAAASIHASETDEAHALGIALEFAALLLVGLGTFALLGNNLVVSWELVLGRIGDVIQELSLIISSPIVPYVQSLAFTGVEALATLLLLVMGFDRVSNGLFQAPMRRDPGE